MHGDAPTVTAPARASWRVPVAMGALATVVVLGFLLLIGQGSVPIDPDEHDVTLEDKITTNDRVR